MSKEKYQRWANYQTWNVKLWIDNDEELQRRFEIEATYLKNSFNDKNKHIRVLSESIQNFVEKSNPLNDKEPTMYSDVLINALAWVNYREIAEAYLEE